MGEAETLQESLERRSREQFLATGRFGRQFGVTRQEFLQLLDELRASRTFYSLSEALGEPPQTTLIFSNITVTAN